MDISFLVRCMLDVCYMFEQHITCFKPFVQGRLKGVMLYGYMFFSYPYARIDPIPPSKRIDRRHLSMG